jgi:hypothetical protein
MFVKISPRNLQNKFFVIKVVKNEKTDLVGRFV